MIDMRNIHDDDTFKKAIKEFEENLDDDCEKVSECNWSILKDAFLEFSIYKCPICETHTSKWHDTDHFRPKKKEQYPFLKCCHKNYMIMCVDCNRGYKKNYFPLYDNFIAKNSDELEKEKPLLINPMHDNIYNFFELEFITIKDSRKVLALKPKNNLSGYELEKAKTTINTYGIGNCTKNKSIDSCRLELLSVMHDTFINLAEAVMNYKKNPTSRENKINYLRETKKESLKNFGFYQFIIKNQFQILSI